MPASTPTRCDWKQWLQLPLGIGLLVTVTKSSVCAQTPPQEPLKWGQTGDKAIYRSVEQMPVYPGGHPKMRQDVAAGLHYSPAAKAARVGGQVFVGFVVGPDGMIRDVQLEQGLRAGPGQEHLIRELHATAVQAVRQLTAQWRPGRQNNKLVAVAYTIPVLLQP